MNRHKASRTGHQARPAPQSAHWAIQAAKLKILLEALWRMSCARASGDRRSRIPAEQFEGDLRSIAEIVNDMAGC